MHSPLYQQHVARQDSHFVLVMCRETEQTVDEHFKENGPYKPLQFKQKYAKRSSVQYLVSA